VFTGGTSYSPVQTLLLQDVSLSHIVHSVTDGQRDRQTTLSCHHSRYCVQYDRLQNKTTNAMKVRNVNYLIFISWFTPPQ